MPSLIESIPLLKEAGPGAAADVEAAGKRVTLPGGEALFHAGDPANALHFLLAGALGVVRREGAQDELVGYVRSGEPVGEMALIAGGKHTASVYALRDCELLQIARSDYERLWHAHPALIQSLAKRMLERARSPLLDHHAARPRVFALVGLSASIPIEAAARDLQTRLQHQGVSCALLGAEDISKGVAHFEELERSHDIVLIQAHLDNSPWVHIGLRQADRIWLFARADTPPPNVSAYGLDNRSAARRFRLVDLIQLGDGTRSAFPPQIARAVQPARRLQWHNRDDAERLARVIAGRSVALVLSGGGARAYAHIGVIKALREERVPIDFTGGTSMGAIIAAGLALGWSDKEFEERIKESFVFSNPLGDHRLPVVALTEGRLVEERLAKAFDGVRIEDMPLPFFCVSTDLVAGATFVHREGPLTNALRASVALPGVLPPVADREHVLVDGAVLNNLPTDVMDGLHQGTTIGVDVAQRGTINPADFIHPPGFFRWIATHGLKTPPPIVSLLMRTATLSVDPSANRKSADLTIIPELGNVEMRDWKAYEPMVEAGYVATLAALRSDEGRALPRIA